MKKFTTADVELVAEQQSYRGFFQLKTLQLRHRLFAGGWSESISRELFMRGDAVGVLLYDPNLDVVALVEQFRIGVLGREQASQQPASPWVLELVAGMVEAGENPAEVAQREASEEAAVTVQSLEPIAQYYASPGGSDEYLYLYAGKVDLASAGGVHGLAGEHEDIRVHLLSSSEFLSQLEGGDINNAHTLIAAQWFLLNQQRLKQQWCS